MPKLKMKRTPAEEAERAWRKARRAARKAANRKIAAEGDEDYANDSDSPAQGSSSQRKREPSPGSSHSRKKRSKAHDGGEQEDDEALRKRMEDEMFRAKLADAFEEDNFYDQTQRLDNYEANVNEYVHVPRRWKGVGGDFSVSSIYGLDDEFEDGGRGGGLEPWQMNDDEYAEWVRAGMWRKKNEEEYKERLRRRAEKKEKEKKARELKLEKERLEKEADKEAVEKRRRRERRKMAEKWAQYKERWKVLLDPLESGDGELSFDDIPWPVFRKLSDDMDEQAVSEAVTVESVSTFLLVSEHSEDGHGQAKGPSRDLLKATMLRYHPDKFESRILSRTKTRDRDRVREVAGVTIRILNLLLKDSTEQGK